MLCKKTSEFGWRRLFFGSWYSSFPSSSFLQVEAEAARRAKACTTLCSYVRRLNAWNQFLDLKFAEIKKAKDHLNIVTNNYNNATKKLKGATENALKAAQKVKELLLIQENVRYSFIYQPPFPRSSLPSSPSSFWLPRSSLPSSPAPSPSSFFPCPPPSSPFLVFRTYPLSSTKNQ